MSPSQVQFLDMILRRMTHTEPLIQQYKLHFPTRKQNHTARNDTCGLGYLVKANQVKLTTHVDPLGTDAKDADPLQTPLCVNNTSCHGCW